MDLVGPNGKRYMLTLVDYATRYPEAVALSKIDTETVAEALIDMYSRIGFPEEVLSDLGTQFVSDVIKEVCRLRACRLKYVKDGEQPQMKTVDQYGRDWKSRLKDTYKVAPQESARVTGKRKRLYDGHTRPKGKKKLLRTAL